MTVKNTNSQKLNLSAFLDDSAVKAIRPHLDESQNQAIQVEGSQAAENQSAFDRKMAIGWLQDLAAQQLGSNIDFVEVPPTLSKNLDQKKAAKSYLTREPFEFLRSLPIDQTVELLKDELPITVAAVIQKLDKDYSGRVLTELPMRLRIEVIRVMAKMQTVRPEVALELDLVVREKWLRSQNESNQDGIARLQQILEQSDPSTAIRLSATIERADEELVEKLSIYSDAG